jgi:hypothetical protein
MMYAVTQYTGITIRYQCPIYFDVVWNAIVIILAA